MQHNRRLVFYFLHISFSLIARALSALLGFVCSCSLSAFFLRLCNFNQASKRNMIFEIHLKNVSTRTSAILNLQDFPSPLNPTTYAQGDIVRESDFIHILQDVNQKLPVAIFKKHFLTIGLLSLGKYAPKPQVLTW